MKENHSPPAGNRTEWRTEKRNVEDEFIFCQSTVRRRHGSISDRTSGQRHQIRRVHTTSLWGTPTFWVGPFQLSLSEYAEVRKGGKDKDAVVHKIGTRTDGRRGSIQDGRHVCVARRGKALKTAERPQLQVELNYKQQGAAYTS